MFTFFVLLVIGIFGYMVFDGLVTEEVWVRGPRKGFSLTQWGHKRSRIDEPISYWFFMILYSGFALFLVYLLILEWFRQP